HFSGTKKTSLLTKSQAQLQANLLTKFLTYRRQGLSLRTIEFYEYCLKPLVRGYPLTSNGINSFLADLTCSNAKANYHQAIVTFVRWLLKTGYLKEDPLEEIEKPKRAKKMMPSVALEQMAFLVNEVNNLRDKAIISLLFDSGMRLTELSNIKPVDINWDSQTITIWGKGNKQRKAPFTKRSAVLLREWLCRYSPNGGSIWDINKWGIQTILKRLGQRTGIKCNPHSFRRGFACNLHRKGLSTLDIMHLGGWEHLSMVLKYTKSITF
ncbi:tyrosine-type recombinase/integrase, partial [Chloroflexota bacterium]